MVGGELWLLEGVEVLALTLYVEAVKKEWNSLVFSSSRESPRHILVLSLGNNHARVY